MSSNPLIQDLIENDAFPTVTVALPTGARWYPKGVLADDTNPLELEVGVLGILAEQNYRDPWLMLSGESIPRLLKSVCPSIVDASEIAEIDLEAILLAARMVSSGPTIKLTHLCPEPIKKPEEEAKPKTKAKDEKSEEEDKTHGVCMHEHKLEIDINEHILRYDVISDAVVEERFTYALTRVAQVAHLRPLPYHRSIAQIKEAMERERDMTSLNDFQLDELISNADAINRYTKIIDMSSETALENILAAIEGISTTNGKLVVEKEFVRAWLLALPADEAEGITDAINAMTLWFNSFSEIKYTCEACGAENKFRLELDANRLFGQAGDSVQPKKLSPKSKSGVKRRRIR